MIKKIIYIFIYFNIFGRALDAAQVTLGDEHVLIALEFDTPDFVPAPFRGEWKMLYYDPLAGRASKGAVASYEFFQDEDNKYTIVQKLSSSGTSVTLKLVKSLDDWTFGFYDAARRKDIIDGKYLLDYDKKLRDLPEGILPQEITIEKHVVSLNKENKIFLVIYLSKNLDLLKKYHRMPIFHEWGKPDEYWYQSIGR